jgi:hypothetical protein
LFLTTGSTSQLPSQFISPANQKKK